MRLLQPSSVGILLWLSCLTFLCNGARLSFDLTAPTSVIGQSFDVASLLVPKARKGLKSKLYTAAVLDPKSGKVYGIPGSAKGVLIYDPGTSMLDVSTLARTPTRPCGCPQCRGNMRWSGGVYSSKSRKIYGIPYCENDVLVIDPATDESWTIQIRGGRADPCAEWTRGVYVEELGKVYGIPRNAGGVLEIDTLEDVAFGHADRYSALYIGPSCCKYKDGLYDPTTKKIYAITELPGRNHMIKIDPFATAWAKITFDFSHHKGGWSAWKRGWSAWPYLKRANGKIYGIPCSFDHVLEFDPRTEEINPVAIALGATHWAGGELTPNGDILVWKKGKIAVINGTTRGVRHMIVDQIPDGWNKCEHAHVSVDISAHINVIALPGSGNSILKITPLGGSRLSNEPAHHERISKLTDILKRLKEEHALLSEIQKLKKQIEDRRAT